MTFLVLVTVGVTVVFMAAAAMSLFLRGSGRSNLPRGARGRHGGAPTGSLRHG